MRPLGPQEKRALKAKINQLDRDRHTKEQGVLRIRHARRRSRISLSNWIRTAHSSYQGYGHQLRQNRQRQAVEHTVDAGRSLRRMDLSDEQREALQQRLACVGEGPPVMAMARKGQG